MKKKNPRDNELVLWAPSPQQKKREGFIKMGMAASCERDPRSRGLGSGQINQHTALQHTTTVPTYRSQQTQKINYYGGP